MLKRSSIWFFLLLILGFLSTDTLRADYVPDPSTKGPLSDLKAMKIYFGQVEDVRQDKDKIGKIYSLMGTSSKMKTEEDLLHLIKMLVVNEFEKNGHSFVDEREKAELEINVILENFWFDIIPKLASTTCNGIGEMKLIVKNVKSGTVKYEGKISAVYSTNSGLSGKKKQNQAVESLLNELGVNLGRDPKLIAGLKK